MRLDSTKWKICIGCGTPLYTTSETKRACGDCCRPELGEQSTGTKGAISELYVCSDLLLRDYEVYRAVSPNSYGDLVAIKDNVKHIIEVRGGRYTSAGDIFFPTSAIEKDRNDKVFGVVFFKKNKFNKILYLDVNKNQLLI